MTAAAKGDWLVPAGLVALGVIPVAAGALRVLQIAGGAAITPDNARFLAAPWPVLLHITSAVVYCILGAFQFAPGLRRRRPGWHRPAGRVLVPCGLVVALSGLWMTQFYPPANFDGPVLYGIRLVVGAAMAVFLCLGLVAVRRRDIPRHRAWMVRAYALGLGAGTQVFTHLPGVLFPVLHGELARTVFMASGWAINIVLAEWLIARWRGEARTQAGCRDARDADAQRHGRKR